MLAGGIRTVTMAGGLGKVGWRKPCRAGPVLPGMKREEDERHGEQREAEMPTARCSGGMGT